MKRFIGIAIFVICILMNITHYQNCMGVPVEVVNVTIDRRSIFENKELLPNNVPHPGIVGDLVNLDDNPPLLGTTDGSGHYKLYQSVFWTYYYENNTNEKFFSKEAPKIQIKKDTDVFATCWYSEVCEPINPGDCQVPVSVCVIGYSAGKNETFNSIESVDPKNVGTVTTWEEGSNCVRVDLSDTTTITVKEKFGLDSFSYWKIYGSQGWRIEKNKLIIPRNVGGTAIALYGNVKPSPPLPIHIDIDIFSPEDIAQIANILDIICTRWPWVCEFPPTLPEPEGPRPGPFPPFSKDRMQKVIKDINEISERLKNMQENLENFTNQKNILKAVPDKGL